MAREANLEAIRRDGLTLVHADGAKEVAAVTAGDYYAATGPQDLVNLATKAHQVMQW